MEPEAPRCVGCGRDTDTGTGGYPFPRDCVAEAHLNGAFRVEEARSVGLSRDVKGLGQAGWPPSEVSRASASASESGHVGSVNDLAGPEQDSSGGPLCLAHNVDTPVHSIGEIHIKGTWRAEHRSISPTPATVGMGGRVTGASVRLRLGHTNTHTTGGDLRVKESHGSMMNRPLKGRNEVSGQIGTTW
jgi:hypothetical protein